MNARIVAALALVAAVALADCNNAADRAVFDSQRTTFHATMQQCSVSCWGAKDCVSNCMIRATGLSPSCAECFGADAACMGRYCIKECVASPTGPKCIDCHTKKCEPAMLECAKVPEGVVPK
eukprot:m51a1_g8276 hypothetical protein (122) ;mRNA; f:78623-79055